MELVKKGYKKTILGSIPNDWNEYRFEDVLTGFSSGMTPYRGNPEYYTGRIPWITSGELNYNIITDTFEKITVDAVTNTSLKIIPKGTFLMAITGLEAAGTRGSCAITGIEATTNQSCMALYPIKEKTLTEYLYHFYVRYGNEFAFKFCQGTKQQSYTGKLVRILPIVLPPTLTEQKAIADALTDVDELITNLEKLIAKKKAIKQGTMQQLLTPPHKGGKRLEGFSGEWVKKSIENICDCLDNLRVPINESERSKMKGDIPYCGANGIVDYINNYILDDDIILMAEDGGYFDEYKTRPIAYRMKGKCWVNNHAHIIKAKNGISQAYIYYSLVNKNILDYINGGTRAKLNKSELYKIEIWMPIEIDEQNSISTLLEEMDVEIDCLETKLNKLNDFKQGMMQELLTGKTRLI
jgi:type I restriction enzyme S subunit